MMSPETRYPVGRLGRLGRLSRVCAWVMFGYWGLYALVTPVTNVDAQMYNVARVALAERGGFFNNPYWTSAYQVMLPWTYDAVHLPFLQLGYGFALPSFFCLVGTCIVVLRMVGARFGADAGWVAVLGLLALPCLVYQATSTKNDIPLVFCVAVWSYGFWRWREERRWSHLLWMTLAIAFMSGAKSTGLIMAAPLAGMTLLAVVRDRRRWPGLAAGLGFAVLLFGSVETYVESVRCFRHPLGPPSMLDDLRNQHGLRGAAANLSRHVAGSIYLGQSEWEPSRNAILKVAEVERRLLTALGWIDAGSNFRSPDSALFFHQSGLEELSGYGPLGTAGVALACLACCWWCPRSWWWRLAGAALTAMLLVSSTAVYSVWGGRYLLVSYALLTVGCVCFLWEADGRWRRLLRWCLTGVAIVGAIGAPLVSFNRTPASLVAALLDRQNFETCNVPIDGRVRARLHELKAAAPSNRVVIGVYHDSVVLPYLTDESLGADVISNAALPALFRAGRFTAGDLVVLEFEVATPHLALVEIVTAPNVFSSGGNRPPSLLQRFIYRYREGPGAG